MTASKVGRMPDCDHLIIDGHNLIHAIPEWKRLLKSQQDRARDLLAEWVRPIHDMDEVRTTIVFDGKGPDLTVERPFKDLSFSYVFSPGGVTADTVIEQMVSNAADPGNVVVGTNDRVLQHTVLAAGSQVMSHKELDAWIRSCESRIRRHLG